MGGEGGRAQGEDKTQMLGRHKGENVGREGLRIKWRKGREDNTGGEGEK